jgi:hypothetical protein
MSDAHTRFRSGTYNGICDVCGRKMKASDLKLRWDGYRVCEQDWEMRHPQELLRMFSDQRTLPFTRPDSSPFITGQSCPVGGVSAVGGIGVAGCMIAGYPNTVYTP